MTSIAIRIINCDNKIALDWTFIDLDQSFLSYKDLVVNIFKGDFPQCLVKGLVFTLYGLTSTSHKEDPRNNYESGGAMTNTTLSERSEQKNGCEANVSFQLGVWGRYKPPSGVLGG